VQHYSAANYYTPGWVAPRDRLRDPFPRARRRRGAGITIGTGGVVAPGTGPTAFQVKTVASTSFSVKVVSTGPSVAAIGAIKIVRST
jgi:hypothetical protein